MGNGTSDAVSCSLEEHDLECLLDDAVSETKDENCPYSKMGRGVRRRSPKTVSCSESASRLRHENRVRFQDGGGNGLNELKASFRTEEATVLIHVPLAIHLNECVLATIP